MRRVSNIFTGIPDARAAEVTEELLRADRVWIERITSQGQASPEGLWYDQPGDEWVVLLKGAATIEFADGELVELGPGDAIDIPARVRHRVARTAPDTPTVWLAVFYDREETDA